MHTSGYIYVLINASMNGLVKVGKTTRDPQGRAKELSKATGIPTPFILAFDAYFDNCTSAEQYIHYLLEHQGYRVAANREFFNAPLSDVIKTVIKAQSVLSTSAGQQLSDGNLSEDVSKADCEDVYSLAEEYYLGLGDTLQDDVEALRLFKQAIVLGSIEAYRRVGIMYKNGEGCKASSDKAIDYFKQGINKGDDRCWAEMALLYYQLGNDENSRKCWDKYFHSKGFVEDEPEDGFHNRVHYGLEYICCLDFSPLPTSQGAQLSTILNEMLKLAAEHVEMTKDQKDNVKSIHWVYKRAIRRIELLQKGQF